MDSIVTSEYKKIPLKTVFKKLKSSPRGLCDREAKRRSRLYGFNEILKKKKINPFVKFLTYFKNPLIIILIISAAISGMVGEYKNAVIIVSMVFLSILLNFLQEHKSNKAAEKIAKKLALRTNAIRNGIAKEILVKYVVPGDIITLSAGDIIPADGKIITSDDLFIDESALTGESFPVEKTSRDANSLLFSGTTVISGSASCVIINTGTDSEYGKIASHITRPQEINAFEVGIKNFGYLIVRVIIFIVLAIFLINSFYKKDIIDSLIFSLAIAVGVTPELLPMIMSITMARGSIAMSKKGVIVKRLSAIPDFGSMDILCTDKTGTLTENKISLVKYIDSAGSENNEVLRYAYINGFFETGIKSLLDNAILEFKHIHVTGLKKIDEIPYDFMRKRSSIIYKDGTRYHMTTKGAPEEIFKICSQYTKGGKQQKLTDAAKKKINTLYENLSKEGFRVLGVATKKFTSSKKRYSIKEEADMVFAGFVAFLDPPKKSSKETISFMREHGIEIKIITGDSHLVTEKICRDLEIPIKGIIVGEDIDINKLTDEALAAKAIKTTIFARISPTQKERIIAALKQTGSVVGYLGDGFNDAPSLKTADVGISVENAVDVVKETADIILLNKGLKELMDGIIEGRKTFGNTIKYMMMGISSNFGNMFSMIGAALFLPFFPMLPGQILLNNFLYDLSQLSIPVDSVDKEYLSKPKHWDMKFIKYFMCVFGPISSIFDFLTFAILYSVFHLEGSIFQTGWFIESLATQVLVIHTIRTRKIPFIQSRPNKYLLLSTFGAVGAGILLTTPIIGNYLGFTWLPPKILLILFLLVAIYLLFVELVKRLFYRLYDKYNPAIKQ